MIPAAADTREDPIGPTQALKLRVNKQVRAVAEGMRKNTVAPTGLCISFLIATPALKGRAILCHASGA